MRKMLVVSTMGLLVSARRYWARALPIPDAHRFTEHDIQAPLAAGDDFQAPWLDDRIQAP